MGKGSRSRAMRQQEVSAFRLTPAQQKALRREIKDQILEHDKEYWLDIDACTLWVLHECFGFGATRLKRFFDAFSKEHDRLREYYMLDDDTNRWICRYLLKRDLGIDVEEWEREAEQNQQKGT